MRAIKTILIFIFSATYTSCIWLLFVLPAKSDYKIGPALFLTFTTIFILTFGIYWLMEHWDDE